MTDYINSLSQVFLIFLNPLLILIGLYLIALVFIYVIRSKEYKRTEYYNQTKNPFYKILNDRGMEGEYLTYLCLSKLDGCKKFLFNVYLPKDNNETTEIDVIMLHESGIYVFESKNYSGWIFGSEFQQNWTQTLRGSRRNAHKEHFLNPIIQNKVHKKWLRQQLSDNSLPIYSYIVFGKNCVLKHIELKTNEQSVLNINNLYDEINKNFKAVGIKLTKEQIESVYSKLVIFTNVDTSVKIAHIKDVEVKRENRQFAGHLTKFKNSPIVQTEKSATNEYPEPQTELPESSDTPAVSVSEAINEPNLNDSVETRQDNNPVIDKICPRCGAKLVIRIASHGKYAGNKFWGCSAFPKCRYIEEIASDDNNDKN